MPRFEDGRFLPIEEDGESCEIDPQSADDEIIENRTILSRQGRIDAIEQTRVNPLYASEVYSLEAFYDVDPSDPQRMLGAVYRVSDTLLKEVTYQEHTVSFDTGASATNRSATIAFFPEDNDQIDVCTVTYNALGQIRDVHVELDTQEALVNHPTDQHVMVTGELEFRGDERVHQSIQVDDDDELDDGIWLTGKPIDITSTITWTPSVQKNTVQIDVCTPGGKNEFTFPKTLDPKDMKRLLSQDKRIGGVFVKQRQDDVVE